MIVENDTLPVFELPGLKHQTIAGHAHGVKTMEVWYQTMDANSATPVHRHACEEVIFILSGSGKVMVEGETSDFGPNCTLIVPPDAIHQIFNTGEESLVLVAALGTAPVRVQTAEGEPLSVPWAAP